MLKSKRLLVIGLMCLVLVWSAPIWAGDLPLLHEIYADDFEIGFAARQQFWLDEPLLDHFNTVTAENIMKWESIHPQPDRYRFTETDYLVNYAEEHGMNVVGHTLVWHSQTPAWVFTDEKGQDVSREELLARMEAHIKEVVGRYKGRIKGWDVVNEAIEQNPITGKWELRDSKWKDIIGDDFIEYAFKFAHEADPEAELYYNDYSATDPGKRDAIYDLVRGLLDKGLRVDGIGMQGHWELGFPGVDSIREAIKKYSSLGVKVHITELDISVYSWNDRANRYQSGLPEEVNAHLAERYTEVFRVFKEHNDVIDRITFWGVKDNYSWKNNFPVRGRRDYPLLFDSQAEAKPAFWGAAAPGLGEPSWQNARKAYQGH